MQSQFVLTQLYLKNGSLSHWRMCAFKFISRKLCFNAFIFFLLRVIKWLKPLNSADNDTNTDNQVQCNCRNKDQCPLDNKCLTSSVIYNAQVTTNNATKNYIGLTEGTFKQRFSQHKATFKHRKYTNSTELSKYIWKLRDNNQGHPTTIFGRISVRKAILDLEFSKHLLQKFLACLPLLGFSNI